MPDYSWVTTAPISYVPPQQVKPRVKRFIELLEAWGKVGGGAALAKRLDDHGGNANFIAGLIKAKRNQDERARPVYEYKLAGEPIAMMMLDLAGSIIEIKFLATHPGSENAGGIMVEYALNRAAHYNAQGASYADGKLYLEYLDDAAKAAYEALGFKDKGNKEMLLNAKKSALWKQVGGAWKLAKYESTKYLAAS